MEIIHAGKRNESVKNFRILSSLILMMLCAAVLLVEGTYVLVFLTVWGIFLSAGYFSMISLAYKFKTLEKACCYMFGVIWGINWGIFVVYWSYVHTRRPTNIYITLVLHCLPLGLTIIDYTFSKFVINKRVFHLPMIITAIYTAINFIYVMTYNTELYPGVNYTNLTTYLVILLQFSVMIVALYLGQHIKKSRIQHRKNTQLLTELQ